MEELIYHIKHELSTSMFMDEQNVCTYNYVIAKLYRLIKDTLLAGADSFELTPISFACLRDGEVLETHRVDRPKPTVSFYSQFHVMLNYDAVLRQHVSIVTDTPDELICEFVLPK